MITRHLLMRDVPHIVRLDASGYDEESLVKRLRGRHCVGRVTVDEHDNIPTAFVVYELTGSSIEIVGICAGNEEIDGRMLIDDMISRLLTSSREYISIGLHETNLDAQLFFKASGFRAVAIEPDMFGDDGAGYQFVYAKSAPSSRGVVEFYAGGNR